MSQVLARIEKWKLKLLDLGKRNRLLNYKDTRRSNIAIAEPDIETVYDQLVNQSATLEFVLRDKSLNLFNYDLSEDEASEETISSFELEDGQVLTNRTDTEMLKTLSQVRAKAKTALEEQGVNVLYLAFGFLQWKESTSSNIKLKSPLILVPVQLSIESFTEPYKLSMTDDDVVVNPTLMHKLEKDFGITFPEFSDDNGSLRDFYNVVSATVNSMHWEVIEEVHLSLFSFLKLNMYEDLEKHAHIAATHPIIKALAGDKDDLKPVPEELTEMYDHDRKERPIDTFQILDADSSQLDAILAAKRGVSFVLQGPPGTGKSQTITNIIGESLASGKTVLFVSEKMAALDVVHNRLQATGISDFCLQLHSHKAHKKEVLDELGRSLSISKCQTRDEAMADLDYLLEERTYLNNYCQDLHTPCDPLGKTIYEVQGRLLKHQYAPDIVFDFPTVEMTSTSDLNRYKRIIEQFARTVSKMGADYLSNPWHQCKASSFSFELQHDIQTNFSALIALLRNIQELCNEVDCELGLSKHNSLNELEELFHILEISSKSVMPPVEWILGHEPSYLIELAKKYSTVCSNHKTVLDQLLNQYNQRILDVDQDYTRKTITECLTALSDQFDERYISSNEELRSKRTWLYESILGIETHLQELNQIANSLSLDLHLNLPESMDELEKLADLVGSIMQDPRPSTLWFSSSDYAALKRFTPDARDKYDSLTTATNSLIGMFDKEILDIDYSSVLIRFRTDYATPLKYFKPSYYKDRFMFKALKKDPDYKLKDKDLVKFLGDLKTRDESLTWIDTHKELMRNYWGVWFDEELTDWNGLNSAYDSFDAILSYFGGTVISEPTQSVLLTSISSLGELKHHYELCKVLFNKKAILDLINEMFTNINSSQRFTEIITAVEQLIHHLSPLYTAYDQCAECLKTSSDLSFSQLFNDLDSLSDLKDLESQLATASNELRIYYGSLFSGLETDWATILNSLKWSSEFKVIVEQYNLPSSFVQRICNSPETIDFVSSRLDHLRAINSKIKIRMEFLATLFPINRYATLSFDQISGWLEDCLNDFSALEDWIDFSRSRELCESNGLRSFVYCVLTEKIPGGSIIGAFLKRFYRLWLDAMFKRFPLIADFRRKVHESSIENFKELDKKQLLISQARIREFQLSRRPSFGSISSGRGELDILRHELNKRRRIMPLRKLFREIPTLLLTIKPCLMMSPLTVSLFLDPDYFKFDLVIFDEASQVCPEDAIGAIYRASQVIIAGDSEQLPPTNFFSVSTGDSDYDEDDDEVDVESFESILDETKSIIPEKTLRWHYRSKHEHLITFSNAKIYKNLITFPSTVDRVSDQGVEYVFVPNGIYDRSGTRSNKEEARKVAELILDHFRRFPRRSLGVVTFSQAQQNQVDAEIRHLRANNPQFEDFFSDSRDEPFFIKNLENVQGDERDTIIFSIGYAKNQAGKMIMNFGPLSRNGGYRRLNVAITRAKYNVKLVSSIRPTDIDLDRTSAEGVKMLREYMEFAINGPDSLLREIIEPSTIALESPFEEEVYNFLAKKGYRVATQVGCSGYRIDMAIKHPTLSGVFVIGIECDGATYHSARIARERDRLREDVLRNRGWKLHRIWSTDWIKSTRTEEERLISAIEEALATFDNEDDFDEPQHQPQEHEILNEITEQAPNDIEAFELSFAEYQSVPYSNLERKAGETSIMYLARIITHVVEVEGPIHFELLCKKLAFVFGREKATSVVRSQIQYMLDNHLARQIKVNQDFCWMVDQETVIVRVPGSGVVRKVEHICTEELAEAMFTIVSYRFGIAEDDLYSETARIFGFARTGGRIRAELEKALIYLIDLQRVNERDGKISI